MKVISTNNAPAAIGPYSQAIVVRPKDMLFISGQIAIDPQSGDMVGTTTKEQTEQVLKNIEAILKASNFKKSDVIKVTVFMKDLSDFGDMNDVYEAFFEGHKPVRAAVEVAELPKNALIEIEVIAVREE